MLGDLTTSDFSLLALAFVLAVAAQLSRQLAQPRPLGLRRLLAGGLGAGLAAVATDVLLLAWFSVGHALLLAVGLVVGWAGPGVLARLALVIEGRYGLRPPDREG